MHWSSCDNTAHAHLPASLCEPSDPVVVKLNHPARTTAHYCYPHSLSPLHYKLTFTAYNWLYQRVSTLSFKSSKHMFYSYKDMLHDSYEDMLKTVNVIINIWYILVSLTGTASSQSLWALQHWLQTIPQWSCHQTITCCQKPGEQGLVHW